MNTDMEQRVKKFVAEQTVNDPERLTMETTLFGDLGVDGADGWELIESFANEFNVDISEFDHSKHFGPEAGAFPVLSLVQLFREHILREDSHTIGRVAPIAIRDMVAAAESRRWRYD